MSCHRSLSISPDSIRKGLVSWCFEGGFRKRPMAWNGLIHQFSEAVAPSCRSHRKTSCDRVFLNKVADWSIFWGMCHDRTTVSMIGMISATYSSLINGVTKSTLNFILNRQKPHRKDLVLKKKNKKKKKLFELWKLSRNRKSISTTRFYCGQNL